MILPELSLEGREKKKLIEVSCFVSAGTCRQENFFHVKTIACLPGATHGMLSVM